MTLSTMKKVTWLVMGIGVAAWILWDIYVVMFMQSTDASISRLTLYSLAYQYQMVPFGVGIVVMHLFWPSKDVPYHWQRVIALGVLSAVVVAVDLWVIGALFPLWSLLAGGAAGKMLWPQRALPLK